MAYAAKDISILKGLQPVRERPGMYIGSTGPSGLHHLVYEVVDNSVDEALAGYADRIDITLLADGGCRVVDNGRGIPVDPHPEYPDKSAAEIRDRLPGEPPLKFIPGLLPEPGSGPTPATPQLSPPATVEQHAQADSWAAVIEDEGLRELVARAAAASLAKHSG